MPATASVPGPGGPATPGEDGRALATGGSRVLLRQATTLRPKPLPGVDIVEPASAERA